MLVATPYTEPRPAVEANRLLAVLGRADVLQRVTRLVERPAHAARSASRATLAALQIAVEIILRNPVELAQPDSRQLPRPHQSVNELIRDAKHIGDLFQAHISIIFSHIHPPLLLSDGDILSFFIFIVNGISCLFLFIFIISSSCSHRIEL